MRGATTSDARLKSIAKFWGISDIILDAHSSHRAFRVHLLATRRLKMHYWLNSTGTFVGVLGFLLCLSAGISRMLGSYYLAGYGASVILSAGTALMVLACLLKLETLLSRLGRE